MRHTTIFLLTFLCFASAAIAAEPPGLMNYQGVLRNDSDEALDGSHDMTFRFYDTDGGAGCSGGALLLTDTHAAAGSGAVQVTGGLFNVLLGGGDQTPGTESSLAVVFRENDPVYMEVQVGAEELCPRIRVVSAGYALNAGNLGGHAASYFLDSSSSAQTKAGLLIAKGGVDFGAGGSDDLTAMDVTALTGGGYADSLHTHNSVNNASTVDNLDSSQFLRSDASDSLTSGTLTIGASAGLRVTGTMEGGRFQDLNSSSYYIAPGGTLSSGKLWSNLSLGYGSGTDDDYLYFDQDTEYLRWNEAQTLFELSQNTSIFGELFADRLSDRLDPSYFIDPANPVSGVLGGHLYIGHSSTSDSDYLYFDGGTEHLLWNNAALRFEASDDLYTSGSITSTALYDVSDSTYFLDPGSSTTSGRLSGNLYVGYGSTTDDDFLYFDGSSESLRWENTNSRFYFSDELYVNGQLVVNGVMQATRMNDGSSGTYFSDPSGTSNINGLRVNYNNALFNYDGPEGDFSFYIYNAGNTMGEFIRWDDSEDAFQLSADLEFETSGNTVRKISNSYDIEMHTDSAGGTFAWFRVFTDGGAVEQMRLEEDDEAPARFDGVVLADGLDYAEAFPVLDATLEPGEVVAFLPGAPGHVARADAAYSPYLAGVISGNPGFVTGAGLGAEAAADEELAAQRQEARLAGDMAAERKLTLALQDRLEESSRKVALAGRVPVKVDGSYGAIQPGDHLTSSPTPGHAMVMDREGPSLGIALEGFAGGGTGEVLAFVNRGHFAPTAELEAGQQALADELDERTPDPESGVQSLAGNLQIVLDLGADDQSRFSVFRDGQDGVASEVFRVDEQGNVFAGGSFRPAAMDLAEYFPVSEPVAAGDVLVADTDRPGSLRPGTSAADPAVVGVVSTEPGILLGGGLARMLAADPERAAALDEARAFGDADEEARLWNALTARFLETHAALAMTGTVPCKVDAGYGSIRLGDLLTTSPTTGHAMRADDVVPGTVVGKALEPLDAGTGVIRVLVMLR